MAKLISSIDSDLSKRFRDNGADVLREFKFTAGEPLDVPDEYAAALVATYPERFFTQKDWKNREGFLKQNTKEANKLAGGSEDDDGEVETPTLEQLIATDAGELRAIADNLKVRYSPQIGHKTLAQRVFEFLESVSQTKDGKTPVKETSETEDND